MSIFLRQGIRLATLVVIMFQPLVAQENLQPPFPPVPDGGIPRYEVYRIDQPIHIDGKLDDPVWQLAKPSRSFVDLISGQSTRYETRVKVLWDDDYLYFGYAIEEPDVQAQFTKRDSPIWQENDVELFIAGDDAYYELEINARGTLYEGLFVWQDRYESANYVEIAELDRRREGVKWQSFNGVGLKNHPRGLRWAFLGWDLPGLRSAVSIQGTLNDASDQDQGWTVELAIPWRSLGVLNRTAAKNLPPQEGDVWRVDVSRFNKQKAPGEPRDSGGWAWSHHGVWDSHIPECFTYLILRESKIGDQIDP
jgi:hypothetical protein